MPFLTCTGGLPDEGMARSLDSGSQTMSNDGDVERMDTKSSRAKLAVMKNPKLREYRSGTQDLNKRVFVGILDS